MKRIICQDFRKDNEVQITNNIYNKKEIRLTCRIVYKL
jgi:hypothetical protein